MKKNLFLAMLLAVVMPLSFSACSSDDDDNKSTNTEQEEEEPATVTDGLAYFQSAITAEDSNHKLLYYHYGEVLYDNDPEHLYLGVDSWDEAKKTFRNWISSKYAKLTESSSELKAELKDEQGNVQLTVYLKKAEGTKVAEVTFSDESKLRHFAEITFLLNSAWPFNSGDSKWKVGDILSNATLASTYKDFSKYQVDADKVLNFVCIREADNGTRPMFVAVTNEEYKSGYQSRADEFHAMRMSGFAPEESAAKTIVTQMNENWDVIEKALNKACSDAFSGSTDYWIYDKGTGCWYTYKYKDGTKTEYKAGNYFRFLLYFDDKKDADIEDGMTVQGYGK